MSTAEPYVDGGRVVQSDDPPLDWLLIRSDEPADLRQAWRQLRDGWATTAERVRSMPAGSEHHGVDGEWSMVETPRHLVFVHDSWFRRCVLGLIEPFTAMVWHRRSYPTRRSRGSTGPPGRAWRRCSRCAAVPGHRPQRGVGPPRFLRTRPRQAVGSAGSVNPAVTGRDGRVA